MDWYFRSVLLLSLLFLSACTLEANISEIVKMDATFVNSAVIANQKAESVENNYVVQASGGSLTDGEVEKTNQGYTVFLSTQTVIISQTPIE